MLKYMLSLKFGSGPSSCMYSSCGSRRTPMPSPYLTARSSAERSLSQRMVGAGSGERRGGGAEVGSVGVDGGGGVGAAGGRHDVDGAVAEPIGLPARLSLAVDGGADRKSGVLGKRGYRRV